MRQAIVVIVSISISCNSTSHDKTEAIESLDAKALSILSTSLLTPDSLRVVVNLYDSILAIDSTRYRTLINKASLLCRLGESEKALYALAKAVDLNGDLAEAIATEGFILESLGRTEEAHKRYITAIQLYDSKIDRYPDKEEYQTNRAFLILLTKGESEAFREIDLILTRKPSSPLALEAKHIIENFDRREFVESACKGP